MIFAFVEAEKANHSILLMYWVLKVSKSGYYVWRTRAPSERTRADVALTERNRRIYERSRGAYGSLRNAATKRPACRIRFGRALGRYITRLGRRSGRVVP